MTPLLKRLLILAACLAPLCVFGCRFNVRDVGFVDLGSNPYQLYLFIGDDMPAAESETLQSILTATFYDSNVKPKMVPHSQANQSEAKEVVPDNFTGAVPMAVLVSPDKKTTLRVQVAKPGTSVLQTAWDALESVFDSPRRNTILEQVFDLYGVVLIVEGRDAAANSRVRSIADAAVKETTAKLPGLEKEIQKPPTVAIISSEEMQAERTFLWSLGIRELKDAPQAVILYGRGRMIGPVLHGERLNQESISAILDTIGLNCECGLDRKWMQGTMVPLKWDRERKQQAAEQLGFNPESPEIRIEMSQILAKGGPGQGSNRSKIIGDTLDELLAGVRTKNLASNNQSKQNIKSPKESFETNKPQASKFTWLDWLPLVGISILLVGGLILLIAHIRQSR